MPSSYDAACALGVVAMLLCGAIVLWLFADHLYATSPTFRGFWAKTRLPFPHTSFSPYFRKKR